MRWFLGTLSLASLMSGVACFVFILASILSESVIQHYWHGDDDWLWLMLPLGGVGGLAFGLRYQHRLWLHVASAALGVCLIVALVSMWRAANTQATGLAAGLGSLIAAWLAMTFAVTAVVCFCVAAVANAITLWLRRRATADSAGTVDTGRPAHVRRGPSGTL